MHEYSDDPDVVARLAAEFAWAIQVRRRYVELRPDDAVALWARVEELTTALTGLVDTYDQGVWRGKSNWDAAWANARAVLTPKENAVALEVGPEPPSRVVGDESS